MVANPAERGWGRLGAQNLLRVAGAGALATLTMDVTMTLAGVLGGSAFNTERLEPEMIGRWAAGLLHGRFRHDDVTAELPIPGELALGLATHYATGMGLTAAYLLTQRGSARPFRDAMAFGVVSAVLPLFVLFPSLGYGWLGLRSGEPARLTRIMLLGHAAFGAGIGFCALRLDRRQDRLA